MQNGLAFLGLRRWPVRTEVRVGMLLRPAVENLGECGCLSISCGQVLLEREYEHEVAFGGEVHDVLGHNRPALPPGGRGYVCVFGCPETNLGYVNRVMAIGLAQKRSSSYGEHLIDQKAGHASNASRCSKVRRLRSAIARLRSIRARTSSA